MKSSKHIWLEDIIFDTLLGFYSRKKARGMAENIASRFTDKDIDELDMLPKDKCPLDMIFGRDPSFFVINAVMDSLAKDVKHEVLSDVTSTIIDNVERKSYAQRVM